MNTENHNKILVHSSFEIITDINRYGPLDSCLCFVDASGTYESLQDAQAEAQHKQLVGYALGEINCQYILQIDDDEIIEQRDLYDTCIIDEITDTLDVDADTAESLLDGSLELCDTDSYDAEDDWWLQGILGKCAKKQGYTAVRSEDEQGEVIIVDMLGKENDWKLVWSR